MSRLVVSTIEAPASSGRVVSIANDSILKNPGMVIQTIYTRSDQRIAYSAPANTTGTTMSVLNLTITPKFHDSLLIMQWMINGEIHHDTVFKIHRDAALITDSGYEGYNRDTGLQLWSGIAAGPYDANNDSTPQNVFIQYAIPASNTTTRTYAPAVAGSGTTGYTMHLNRTQASLGQNAYEQTVSTGMIMEVAQ